MQYKAVSSKCSNKCGGERRPGQRTCRDCHSFDMKMRRATVSVLKVMKRERAAK
jgi:hypothetical protein